MNDIPMLNDKFSPSDEINGYRVCPGLYDLNGATSFTHCVNFTIHSKNATHCEIVLFKRYQSEPFAIIPIPESYRIGDVWSIFVFDLNIFEIEYCYRMDGPYNPQKGLLFNKNQNILDPYSRAVTGQSQWGKRYTEHDCYHGRISADRFEWGDFTHKPVEFEDMIIYELHVRGFTKDGSANVRNNGTFDAINEKIPYLKKLGINTVELMPVFEFDELDGSREINDERLLNYWGYNTTCFFAPNTGYSSQTEDYHEGDELKNLIKTLHENGIDVILDVVFNHTSEGDENGPVFSFKAIDNSIYYMLTPDGHYYNFSGCGNTVNCNHPVVQRFILDCLRYWVIEYRVDGFRFDLASILGRSENGTPMDDPPLLKSIAYDPILHNIKLIAEAWDAGGLYQVGSFPSWNRWAEWNGKYRDDLRCFLKGDGGKTQNAANRIMGSMDLYHPIFRGTKASVNFLTCHDGFTLYDLYSFNCKHNEANGWDNTDGDNSSNSWNCGCEGETDNEAINKLRIKLVKNAFAVLMCSRGAVMFFAGDEFCNTQFGNNNAYCQDNIISWLDWTRLEKYSEVFDFASFMTKFRKEHKILRYNTEKASVDFPFMSVHSAEPWKTDFNEDSRVLGIMFAGKDDNNNDDIIYIAVNAYWEKEEITLPQLPDYMEWRVKINTAFDFSQQTDYNGLCLVNNNKIMLDSRSVIIVTAVNKQ